MKAKNGPLNVLFIDNFDSFTFNLVDEFAKRGAAVTVWRNDVALERAQQLVRALPRPRLLVLSPGPGRPADAGCCVGLVRTTMDELGQKQSLDVPVFGVCLGHQAIIEACGGRVGFAGSVVHGKSDRIEHDGRGIFRGSPSPMPAARYHSLGALDVPAALTVSARCGDIVMAVRHKTRPIAGVQFHPESILTPAGGRLIESVMVWASEASSGRNNELQEST